MTHYDPDRHHRRSIRLHGYDYTQAGAYFVTMCTWGREALFGEVVGGEMRLNAYGQIVEGEWLRTPTVRPEVEMDVFVVMPNHVHGIVVFTTHRAHNRAPLHQPTDVRAHNRAPLPQPLQRQPRSLGSFVSGFKAVVTKRINTDCNMPGLPVWHRNYYEHIIRSEHALNAIRQYIADNPARWHLDRYNPVAVERDSQALALWEMLKQDDMGLMLV